MASPSSTLIWTHEFAQGQTISTTTRVQHSQAPLTYFDWSKNDSEASTGTLNVYHLENIVVVPACSLDILCNDCWDPLLVNQLNLPSHRHILDAYYPRIIFDSLCPDGSLGLLSSCSRIEEECYLLPGFCPWHMGHFLVEYFPRLLVLCRFIELNNKYLPLYISKSTPEDIIEACRYVFGDHMTELKFFDDNTPTFFSTAIIAPYTDELECGRIGYHPICATLINEFVEKSLSAQGNPSIKSLSLEIGHKIYVSRKHDSCYVSPVASRAIVNEDEVINLLADHGFLIVRMEDYDLEERIRLLSKCKVLIGGWGSGLGSTVLSSCEPMVVALGIGFDDFLGKVTNLMNQKHYEIPTFSPVSPTTMLTNIMGSLQLVNLQLLEMFLETHGLKS